METGLHPPDPILSGLRLGAGGLLGLVSIIYLIIN